jgi:hypothetical protein
MFDWIDLLNAVAVGIMGSLLLESLLEKKWGLVIIATVFISLNITAIFI